MAIDTRGHTECDNPTESVNVVLRESGCSSFVWIAPFRITTTMFACRTASPSVSRCLNQKCDHVFAMDSAVNGGWFLAPFPLRLELEHLDDCDKYWTVVPKILGTHIWWSVNVFSIFIISKCLQTFCTPPCFRDCHVTACQGNAEVQAHDENEFAPLQPA